MEPDDHKRALRCRIGVHVWATRVNAGARWQECARCGKYSGKVVVSNRFPPAGTGEGAGGGS